MPMHRALGGGRGLQSKSWRWCPLNKMDTCSNDGAPRLAEPTSVAGGMAVESEAARHFDAVDTYFFQQADEAGGFGGDERYDESFHGRDKRLLLSYRSLVGVSVASSALAIAACVALFRSNAPLAAPMVAAARVTAPVPQPSVPSPPPATNPAAVPAPPVAATSSAVAGGPAPQDPAGAAVPPAALAVAGVAAAVAIHDPVAPAPVEKPKLAKAANAPLARDESAEGGGPKGAEATGTDSPVATSSPVRGTDARERCRQSIRTKRAREIAAACAAAFAEDATDADAAVAVARVEFDRGRFAQASTWSKKAIAVNPNSAEAYVFAGGAEQNQGHGKAAKEAYLRYLRLAPSGRYAAEIRTIVSSL
jgi:hypothetical protein